MLVQWYQGFPISWRPKAGDKANTFVGQDKLYNIIIIIIAIVTNKKTAAE
jgi:hypothetical protein